ncbi:ROK family protein [Ammoniphilus sp. 3BR4]|uniref:ROK family transcriptional regulator n=1 Tax=Ammoniphilus sp. 3BR4 TaxID=3158265 RepID=UPI0034666E84
MFKSFIEDTSPKNRSLRELYQFIYEHGPIHKAQLLKITQHKQTTLARMIDELLGHGFIRESGTGESYVGRPPVLYHIEPRCSYIVSVTISRMKTEVALFDLLFHRIEYQSFNMTKDQTSVVVLPKIIKMIQSLMEKYRFSVDELLGIGIGAIGPLDKQKGIIVDPEPFFATGWANIPIVDVLTDFFPVKILLENWANAALIGEYKHGKMPNHNILYAINSWGLGVAALVNGDLVSRTGNTTRSGHIIIDPHGRACLCGKRGCLLSYVSLFSILNAVEEQHQDIDWREKDWDRVSTEEVICLLKREQPLVHEAVLESAYYYGIGIANLINTLHSELVILGGPLIHGYPGFFEKVVEVASHYLEPRSQSVKFTQGTLKEGAAVVGSAYLIGDSCLHPKRNNH